MHPTPPAPLAAPPAPSTLATPATPRVPTRYCNLDEARRRFGDRVDRLAPWLHRLDPPADAAVAALAELPGAGPGAAGHDARHPGQDLVDAALAGRPEAGGVAVPAALGALVEAAREVPVWVDWAAIDRGSHLFLRAGVLGGIVLGAKALVYGYTSPGGNKPLMLSGRLYQQAGRRLNETSRFVQAVCRPGGLRAGADGFGIVLKVRLMHAQVRRMILASGRWRAEAWGAPINQHDMVATNLLFSVVTLAGLRQLGLDITRDESDDYMHLWRYAGHLVGVDPALVPATEREGVALAELIAATQGPPDDDSRQLVRALLHAGEATAPPALHARARRVRRVAEGAIRVLMGDDLADQLAIPRTPWVHAVGAARRVVELVEQARRRSPRLAAELALRGARYWDDVVARGLGDATAAFALPERLGGDTSAAAAG